MEETSFNEDVITKENFADIASEKISRILCFPGNDLLRSWALNFLQKSARGFSDSQHEPWLNSLSTEESSEALLFNCKSAILKLGLATPSIESSLPFVISYPRQFNPFISALASLLIRQIEESQQRFCEKQENLVSKSGGFLMKEPAIQTSSIQTCRSYDQNVCGSRTGKKIGRNISEFGPSKRVRTNSETQTLSTEEIMRFLKYVWDWAKTGNIKVDSALMGDVLSQLPECIEEVLLSWAKEELKSSPRRNSMDGMSQSTSSGAVKDAFLNDDEMLHSLSILQESPIFLAAAASSPKLFQLSSSVLNELLIQASECSCTWSSMLSLSKTFAQETAKGRAEFYPLQVQPMIVLMEVDPISLSSSDDREMISSQLTCMCRSLPTKVTVALLSHFPAWLPFLNYAMLV